MDERLYVASHEAGHAVIDSLLNVPFERVSILRQNGLLGFSKLEPPSFESDEAIPLYIDNFTIGGFAGPLAGIRYLEIAEPMAELNSEPWKAFVLEGCEPDFKLIRQFRNEAQMPVDESTLENLESKAERLVLDNWDAIDAVAQQLKDKNELTAQQVQEIVKRFSS
jgi:ATP-dependent Zn protease